MEAKNWRPAQGESTTMDPSSTDWRSQLPPEVRQWIVDNIMDTLKRRLPIAVPESLSELMKIAVRFEERIYSAATNQFDYLQEISLKMLSMETDTHSKGAINPSPSNTVIGNQNPADPVPMDSTAQARHAGVVDWQEEIYQKIKTTKELYLTDLSELYQKIALKLQQHDTLMPLPKQSDQLEKFKNFKIMLEKVIEFLQIPKSKIHIGLKDKLPLYEKQILNMLGNRSKKPSQPQEPQQFQHPGAHSMQHQQQSQVSQLQQNDGNVNQVQQINLHGKVASMESASVPNMQHGSMPLSTHTGVPTTQQNITNSLQPCSNLNSVQGSSFSSSQQGMIGSVQQGGVGSLQNAINAPLQTNINTLSQSSVNTLQPNVNPLQPSSNALQHQHLKQQQQEQQQHQLMRAQKMKEQFQQRHMQQLFQQQQKQQPQLQQQKQQQTAQLQAHQMPQLHQMNEANELKVRQESGIKPGIHQQHYPAGQSHSYYDQQLQPIAPFPIYSPRNLQASSPQISQHASPQIDQHGLLSSLPKAGMPLQSANSPSMHMVKMEPTDAPNRACTW